MAKPVAHRKGRKGKGWLKTSTSYFVSVAPVSASCQEDERKPMPTLDEAIKVGEQYLKEGYIMSTQDFHEFIAIGIEALKFIASWNQKQLPQHQIHLPGETEG